MMNAEREMGGAAAPIVDQDATSPVADAADAVARSHRPAGADAPALRTRVAGFEGPLAVLLRLIEREELDITAISLAQVADQFVAYIAAQPDSDPGLLAEFAAVASRLLVLKTRVLFPRASVAPDR